jgi:hypothetical protein
VSPDLAALLGNQFVWNIDRKNKRLVMKSLANRGSVGRVSKVWSCRPPASRSKLIALRSAIAQLGLDYGKLVGMVYDVKVRGKTLEVQF